MKGVLLFPLIILFSVQSFAQDSRTITPRKIRSIERRIDVLICKLKHKEILDRKEKESLVTIGTVIEGDVAKYQIGKPVQKDGRGSICYTIRYDMKRDKIISITEQG
jgi:hypothetical protein